MNMALRPFSLLLLLLVMIRLAEQKYGPLTAGVFNADLDCKMPEYFCFLLTDKRESNMARTLDPNAKGINVIEDGGITLRVVSDIRWVITIDYSFASEINDIDFAYFSVITTAGKFSITNTDIVQGYHKSFKGIDFEALRYDFKYRQLEFELHVVTGSYIADEFELFADPKISLEIHKAWGIAPDEPGFTLATTPQFKPFTCWVALAGDAPDAAAVKATQTDTTFSCTSGDIFLEGTNIHADKVYCGGGGWFGEDRKMILKRTYAEKNTPYCLKDVMFEDCSNNKCFVFGDALNQAQPADKLIKVDSPAEIKEKLGAYLVFESDIKWKLHLAYNGVLASIRIGKMHFHFDSKDDTSKVVLKVQRQGHQLLNGLMGMVYTLEANTNEAEKDLMQLFEFYTGAANNIILYFSNQKTFEAEGVANFGKYEKTTSVSFTGENALLQRTPDAHNVFTCPNDQRIYLDNVRTGVNEIRFTKKRGWLKKDGSFVAAVNKDTNDKYIMEAVNCFTVCQKESVALPSDPKDQPNKDAAKMEYKCSGGLVKVASNFYASISCENDQWIGDGNNFAVPGPKYTFSAECYGAFKFVKDCSKNDADQGCGKVKIDGVGVSCEDGFQLTLVGHDENKVRKSLHVNKDDHWFDGTDDLGKTAANDRPLCYSKCAPTSLDLDVVADTVEAKYDYKAADQAGTLSCGDKIAVLVVTLDGKKTPFVKNLVCDKDGWKIQGKQEKAAEHQPGKVHAECHKVCTDKLKVIDCPAGWTKPEDCGNVNSIATTVQCSLSSEVLFVNDNPIDKPLECTKEGWSKKGDPTNLIIDHLKQYTDPVKVECFSRCGKKFVSGDAIPTKTTAGLSLSCAESKMIGYKLNKEAEVDTLEKLECDKDLGWKDSASKQLVTFAEGLGATIEANCKTSCSQTLITKKCADRSPGCDEAKLTGEELTCDIGKWLYAQDKVETGTIQCKTKSFESKAPSTAIKIDRASPTSTAEISCLSKCDKTIMVTAGATDAAAKLDEEAGKLTETEANGKLDIACTDELHYTAITHNNDAPTTKYSQKWTCDPMAGWSSAEDPATPIVNWINGENIKKTCRNKCKDRFKPCSGCEPLDADNKLKCADTHMLRTNENNNVLDFEREELVCKKDGFYSKDAIVLKFADKPTDDIASLFDVTCISKCDAIFVSYLDQPMKDKLNNEKQLSDPTHFYQIAPVNNNKKLQCKNDEILFIHSAENPVKGRRVFGETECKEAVGWTGKVATKDASGVWTISTTDDETIVDFASQSAKIVASCIKVCATEMLNDKCTTTMPAEICTRKDYTGSTLSCPPNYRLFLNDKKSQDSSATNTLKCSKEGWKDGNEFVIDFRETPDQIPTIAEVHCKHKCHEDFIEFAHDSCPVGKTCSKAKYEGGNNVPALTCTDATEILVIEHEGKRREGFKAVCSNDGWKDEETGNTLFELNDKNYHIKAHCEQLCLFNFDKTTGGDEVKDLVYDETAKTLTCNDTNMMLAFEGIGVYSDMTCTKDGWKMDERAKEFKVDIKPIISDALADDQNKLRAKKFTCIPNICMRSSFPCSESGECVNPDFEKKKYEMSCEHPSKLAKKGATNDNELSYDWLRCFDGGIWKGPNDQEVIKADDPFNMVCTSSGCATCPKEDLDPLTSTTDANIQGYTLMHGSFTTCSGYKCGTGLHFVIDSGSGKLKYYESSGDNAVKCTKVDKTDQSSYSSPDNKENVPLTSKVGCVKQIPCNEYRPLNTDCEGRQDCVADGLQQRLKTSSMSSPAQPVKCDTLGQLYYKTSAEKKGWKIVNELLCIPNGKWNVTYAVDKDKIEKITLSKDLQKDPHFICAKKDPNPGAVIPEINDYTDTCHFCPFPSVLECEGCKSAQGNGATTVNDLKGKCTMKIVNGRFKINGGEEIGKDAELTCQNMDGQYPWMAPDGKKIESLAVIMRDTDNISTGAIAGIVIAVILVLGLIVFAMVYVAIRKRKEAERQEKLKNKGLEQKQDSIIDGATIVDDTKTLVL